MKLNKMSRNILIQVFFAVLIILYRCYTSKHSVMWQGYSFLVSFNVVLMVTSQRSTIPSSTYTLPSFTKFEAKYMYGMVLSNVNPVAATLVKDRRYSNQITSKFDVVFMSHYQTSKINSVFEVSQKVNSPEIMRSETKVIADATSIQYPNNVGRLPPGSIENQPGYVWWIASGKVEPDFSTNTFSGGIYMLDMTKNQWLPVPIYTESERGFSSVAWVDMDLDNLTDCITIRSSANFAQLIWLRQPPEQAPWQPNVINPNLPGESSSAQDVGGTYFKVLMMRRRNNKKQMLIIVAGKRTTKLTVFWTDDSDNDWTQLNRIRSYVI
uniref:Uncharacterized protein n=2 Tax=Ciona intestinalis TaxID=7719 RepID=F7AXU4_CIOIN